jgi:protein SCO1/2
LANFHISIYFSENSMRLTFLLFTFLMGCWCGPAAARLSQQQLEDAKIDVPAGARLPDAQVQDFGGAMHDIRALADRPTILIFADFTCETLCGPVLAFAGRAIADTRLPPEAYRLIVVGLDPKDRPKDARKMRDAQLEKEIARRAEFVFTDADTLRSLTGALGYRAVYDAASDQYAHPDAAFILAAGGTVSRILSGLGLNGGDLRLALVEAGQGKIGNLTDRVHLLCYGFDPASGTYNLAVSRLLGATGLASMLALGGIIGFLTFSGRRRQS